jgi:hypothetical protein
LRLTDLINAKSFYDENYVAIPPETLQERDLRLTDLYRVMLPVLTEVIEKDRGEKLSAQQSALNVLRSILLTLDRAIELSTENIKADHATN